jgi:hypothetical protein
MGVIEKIIVSDETLKQLERDAMAHGRSLAEEVAARIEGAQSGASREELIERMRRFRESLPPQTSDSLTLLREDRAGNRY